jgi:hypothetical protein
MFGRMGKKPTCNSFFVIWWIFCYFFGHCLVILVQFSQKYEEYHKYSKNYRKMTKK